MTDNQTPPDWVLIEAAKRFEWEGVLLSALRIHYLDGAYIGFRALCDMIHKYEKPPVDRKLLCARQAWLSYDANKGYQYDNGDRDDYVDIKATIRAIELWEEGFGK